MKGMLQKVSLFSLMLCVMAFNVSAEIIRHNKIGSGKDEYQLGLLKLALSYSDTNYEFRESPVALTQTKWLSDLESKNMDIAWVGTSSKYEETFLPIRVPLFKGLLGHRIFLIRQGDQARFNSITSLDELKRVKGGQVGSWTDTAILKNADLNVVTTSKFNNLFYMLDGSRFDYFPRSIYSPWADMAKRPELPLQVEKNLIVVYPLPAYMFVNKDNIKLKNDIESGMFKAIEDGSFDEYFYSHPLIREGLDNSYLENRIILKVNNPYLHPDTPLDDKRLWFDIDEYIADKEKFASANY